MAIPSTCAFRDHQLSYTYKAAQHVSKLGSELDSSSHDPLLSQLGFHGLNHADTTKKALVHHRRDMALGGAEATTCAAILSGTRTRERERVRATQHSILRPSMKQSKADSASFCNIRTAAKESLGIRRRQMNLGVNPHGSI